MKIFYMLIILIFPVVAFSDTLLIGFDYASDAICFGDDSASIADFKWKSQRMQAEASGTISYFKIRVPTTPTGCTSDAGCWAIYEDLGSEDPVGALKADGCFTGYNWTTTGAGDHDFPVVNIGTNLTITSGSYYTFVFWSYAVDQTEYATAGCSSPILAYRGRGESECFDDIAGDMTYAGSSFDNSPPDPDDFDYPAASFFMWSVWSGNGASPATITGITIIGGSIQ